MYIAAVNKDIFMFNVLSKCFNSSLALGKTKNALQLTLIKDTCIKALALLAGIPPKPDTVFMVEFRIHI